ncbi:MAG TPA: hypothetical protein VND98_05050 [Solirubrobacterales bacterium]|nr:hypothetical protein [Solirubrobacterales bacterium]
MKPDKHRSSRRSLTVLTCTIALILVVIAVAAAAASAATPEYRQAGLPISHKISYTWSGGQLNWDRVFPIGKESEGEEIWECKSSIGEGELVNSTEGKLKLTFKECKWKNPLGEVLSCTSEGQGAGTIVTEPLKSHLYYAHDGLNGKGPLVAVVDFSPESGEKVVKKFSCGTVGPHEWHGSLLGAYEKVNEIGITTAHLVIKRQPVEEPQHKFTANQEPEIYETLTSECNASTATSDYLKQNTAFSEFERIGLQNSPDTITFKEGLEIHAPCIP